MSDLQLGLIVIGIAIVAAVYAFNRWQERQLRRRVGDNPGYRAAETMSADDGRVEPRLARAGDAADVDVELPNDRPALPIDPTRPSRPSPEGAESPTAAIDYVCTIEAGTGIAVELLNEFLHRAHSIGKPVAIKGWAVDTSEWLDLPLSAERLIVRAAAALQLANRAGPVNRVQLSSMRDLAQELAERADGVCECPEIDAAAQAAVELDKFCAEVDISIGCNVIPKSESGLAGTKVRGMLESCGYTLEGDGKFWLRAEDGSTLVSVGDADGSALTAERLRGESLSGLTLSMDVPKVPVHGRIFDRMFDTARQLAHALDATVVDDNRTPLTDAGLNVIRTELIAVQVAMRERGIVAGSATALRLFS